MWLIAYTPLVDPIEVGRFWWTLLPPLALLIAVVWKALRMGSLRRYPLNVAIMTFQIVAAMALLGLGAFLFIQYVAPLVLPVRS